MAHKLFESHPTLTNNTRFHSSVKGDRMVDETSLSSILRKGGNSFVKNGWSYGQALAHFLLDSGYIPWDKPEIVEFGGGEGDVAEGFIPVLLEAGKDPIYTMVDLGAPFLSKQEKKTTRFGDRVRLVNANAEKPHLAVPNANVAIYNEVWADFRAIDNIPITRDGEPTGQHVEKPGERALWDVAWNAIERYGLAVPTLEDAPEFAMNYGAIETAKSLREVLTPGGISFVSEFTSPFAEIKRLPGHNEYSLSTRHMDRVLDALGFEWKRGTVNDFLGIDLKKRKVVEEAVAFRIWRAKQGRPINGEPEPGELEEFEKRLVADPSLKVLDHCVDPAEFMALNARHGWGIEKIMTEPIDSWIGSFEYYLMRKPPQADVKLMDLPRGRRPRRHDYQIPDKNKFKTDAEALDRLLSYQGICISADGRLFREAGPYDNYANDMVTVKPNVSSSIGMEKTPKLITGVVLYAPRGGAGKSIPPRQKLRQVIDAAGRLLEMGLSPQANCSTPFSSEGGNPSAYSYIDDGSGGYQLAQSYTLQEVSKWKVRETPNE
jgi:hypothetical protein